MDDSRTITRAGDPLVRRDVSSYLFDRNASEALTELNQAIIHLERLSEICTCLVNEETASTYGIDIPDCMCRLKDLRDNEFGDMVNWGTVAKALRAIRREQKAGG